MEKLLSERQAAALLGISTRHLFGLRKRGEVPYVRLGGRVLYSPEALQRWIEQRLQAAERAEEAQGAAGRVPSRGAKQAANESTDARGGRNE